MRGRAILARVLEAGEARVERANVVRCGGPLRERERDDVGVRRRALGGVDLHGGTMLVASNGGNRV